MSFQWIFDYAETISIENKSVIASTTSRNGIVRAVNRGNSAWTFTVKLPDGIPWQTIRPLIAATQSYDRTISATIQINDSGQSSWLSKYQGNSANSTGFAASWVRNQTYVTLTSSPTTAAGTFKFRAGDWIQLGTGSCYMVLTDVPATGGSANQVNLHRPVLDATGSGSLRVGPNCQFSVYMTQFPTWTIFARDQVSWDSAFVFTEAFL